MTDTASTAAGDEITVIDVPERRRYEARTGERTLGILDYEMHPVDDRIVLIHTEVLPDAEGMGVGSRLAKGALEDIRARGLKLTVECEFVAAYLKRHPRDYEDVLAR
jgi:predicted GNAT family acetyltransferase